MGQDTVLIGAFAFFATGGAIWLILTRLQASSLPERVKRLLTYGLLGLVVVTAIYVIHCLLYTSPSPRDLSTSRMPSSA